MSETAATAQNAVEHLLVGFGLEGGEALSVLRKAAERFTPKVLTPGNAFEIVRLRSIGAEDELLGREGGVVSDAQFAKLLNVRSRQTVHNYREAGRIIAVPRGSRNFLYPVWQIKGGELLPGLTPVLKILHGKKVSPAGVLLFFLTPAEALEGERPLDLLRRSETAEVNLHAERYGDIGS